MKELTDIVADTIVIVAGVILLLYVIYGILLNILNKRKYGKKTIIAWIPILNIFLFGKLALSSFFGLLLIAITALCGIIFIPINGEYLIVLPEMYKDIVLYGTLGLYVLFGLIIIIKLFITPKNKEEKINKTDLEKVAEPVASPAPVAPNIVEPAPVDPVIAVKVDEIVSRPEESPNIEAPAQTKPDLLASSTQELPKANNQEETPATEPTKPVIEKPDLLMSPNGEADTRITFFTKDIEEVVKEPTDTNNDIESIFSSPNIIPVETNNIAVEPEFKLDISTIAMVEKPANNVETSQTIDLLKSMNQAVPNINASVDQTINNAVAPTMEESVNTATTHPVEAPSLSIFDMSVIEETNTNLEHPVPTQNIYTNILDTNSNMPLEPQNEVTPAELSDLSIFSAPISELNSPVENTMPEITPEIKTDVSPTNIETTQIPTTINIPEITITNSAVDSNDKNIIPQPADEIVTNGQANSIPEVTNITSSNNEHPEIW